MAPSYDFVAVGDVMLDIHVASAPLDGILHAPIRVCSGGSAVNAARAAARLGARAAVVGGVGDDASGAAVRDELHREGIDALLQTCDAATGTVVYVATGVVADRGANAVFNPETLPAARVTLVSAYLDERAVSEALSCASGLRAVDLQRPGLPVLDADVLLGPGLEIDRLAGSYDVICSTLGPDGAIAVRGGERAQVRVSRLLEESPRGAGDAFAAGFLLALARGLELAACLEQGCESALSA